MIDLRFIFHDESINIFDILFKFLYRFTLAEYAWNFSEFTNIPSIVLPIFKCKCMFHLIASDITVDNVGF